MRSDNNGAPGAIPTRDLSLRRRALYATELREHTTEIVQRRLSVVSWVSTESPSPSLLSSCNFVDSKLLRPESIHESSPTNGN